MNSVYDKEWMHFSDRILIDSCQDAWGALTCGNDAWLGEITGDLLSMGLAFSFANKPEWAERMDIIANTIVNMRSKRKWAHNVRMRDE